MTYYSDSVSWDLPEKCIWETLSGYPSSTWSEKRILMLQVFIDDSGKSDQSKVLVLAGFLSTAERWAQFSNKWQEILDYHELPAFKMSSAWRLHRHYKERGGLQRDWVIVKLLDCIKTHAEHAFVISIDIEAHAELYKDWDKLGDVFKNIDRCYFAAFSAMMSKIYKHAYKYRFNERINVIFDEQGGESAAFIQKSVEEFRKVAAEYFPGLKVDNPLFKTDEEFPPIQAADMLAWLVRRQKFNLDKGNTGTLESLLLTEALDMPHSIDVWDRSKFADMSEKFPHLLAERLGISPSELS